MRYQTELYVRKRKGNKLIAFLIIVLLVWGTVVVTDYYKTTFRYEKPMFTIESKNVDGDESKYIGLGYSVQIDGTFDPDTDKEFESGEFYIFGQLIKAIENTQE